MPEPIVVAVATDSNFVKQTGALLASLASSHVGEAVDVFVHGDDLDSHEIEGLRKCGLGRIAINIVDMNEVLPKSHALRSRLPTRLPNVSGFRLALAEVLPDQDRVIYLDADTLVRASLRPLWEIDLGQRAVGAVKDAGFPWMATGIDWRRHGLRPENPYFNAGVLLISLEHWRLRDVGPEAFELLRHNDFRFGDQCALNVALQHDWLPLPPTWNMQLNHYGGDKNNVWVSEGQDLIEQARSNPNVVHFHSPRQNRPWEPNCSNPYASEWLAMLDHTPWKGWRPEPPSRFDAASSRAKATIRRRIVARGW